MESDILTLSNLTPLLMRVVDNPDNSLANLWELKEKLKATPNIAVQQAQKYIIGAINSVLTNNKDSMDIKTKSAITTLLEVLFKKSQVKELKIFLFTYKFLLDQIYDHRQSNCVASIPEESKLEVMQAMISLMQSLSWDVLEKIYDKDNALILCQMIYVALEMAKSEQYRVLRVACINCVMCIARVDDSSDFSDVELRCRIADVFILFLPGVTTSLAKIAIDDEKHGHYIALLGLQAWGQIVTLQMQNYGNTGNEPMDYVCSGGTPKAESHFPSSKWQNPSEVKQYLDNTKRTASWYKATDEKLHPIMASFTKLAHHSHAVVRNQLLKTCSLLIEYCSVTVPKTCGSAINNLIMLSEDNDDNIAHASREVLVKLSDKDSESQFVLLFQNLEENLYSAVMALPRVFNRFDENEQLSAINSIVGYLNIFGKTKLVQVLHSPSHVNHLIQGLIHISKIENKDVRLHDEFLFEDLGVCDNNKTPWKNFRYFRKDTIQFKIEQTCILLTTCNGLDIASDLLMEIFIKSQEDRKEATLLLNGVLLGLSGSNLDSDSLCIAESAIDLYMDHDYWNLQLEVATDVALSEVQDNIVQICLQLEGLGKIAIAMEEKFQQKLLKTLYPIFEYAGSDHSLIKTAATLTISNISKACGYSNIDDLINKNLDYLTYHILRKLRKRDETESALKALKTVLRYGNIDILHFFILDLLHSCDKFFQERNAEAYLQVFQMVIKSICKWLKIENKIGPIKSKIQRESEHEPFQISNLPDDKSELDESEDIPITEDSEKAPPMHVNLIEELLKRCVHFLPFKKRSIKILVIEIFKDGLEILREWDNNMLPLVHQVWSPLSDRFKEHDDFVIINYSFQLLIVLTRLSKDFIRSRTVKDVLPHVRQILSKLINSSYLQDKGSAYRYTQAYKLQLFILQHLGRVLIDLDLSDLHIIETMEAVFPYLSNKQPIPIQESALAFYGDLIKFDKSLVKSTLDNSLKNVPVLEKLDYQKSVDKLLDLCIL